MVDTPYYLDTDLEDRQAEALRRLREYFRPEDGVFKWTFSNWDRHPNRQELPFHVMDEAVLEDWARGWKSVGERETHHRMLAEANPSDVCISTNHMLVIAAIRDDATPAEVMEAA